MDLNQLSLFLGKHVCWFGPTPLAPRRLGALRTETTPSPLTSREQPPKLRAINSTKSNKTAFVAFSPKL